MKITQAILTTLLASSLVFFVAACDNKGPMEKAGEKIDDTVEDAGDAIEDATDRK